MPHGRSAITPTRGNDLVVTRKDIGERVEDDRGRVGVLKEVIRDWENPASPAWERKKTPTAFVRDERTGLEWLAPPARVQRVAP